MVVGEGVTTTSLGTRFRKFFGDLTFISGKGRKVFSSSLVYERPELGSSTSSGVILTLLGRARFNRKWRSLCHQGEAPRGSSPKMSEVGEESSSYSS